MPHHALKTLSAALLLALGAGFAAAQNLAAPDKEFVDKAAAGGLYEVEAGKLAQAKGANASVKQFGAMLVADHGKANDELKKIAASKGHTPPAALPKDKQDKLDRMGKLSGAEFDKAFMDEVGLKDHKEDIALFEKTSKDAKDADIRAFATRTLPTLQHHLHTAQGSPVNAGRK